MFSHGVVQNVYEIKKNEVYWECLSHNFREHEFNRKTTFIYGHIHRLKFRIIEVKSEETQINSVS